MLDTNEIVRCIARGNETQISTMYQAGSLEIIEKLGYDFDVYERLDQLFKDPVFIYSFLEGCETDKITYQEAMEYLEMTYWDEWEHVKKLNLEKPEFDQTKINQKEYNNARNLLNVIKKGEFDYYEITTYKRLEPETQKFLRFLLWMVIDSAEKRVEKIDHFINEMFIKNKKMSKTEAINCLKFLEMIKNDKRRS